MQEFLSLRFRRHGAFGAFRDVTVTSETNMTCAKEQLTWGTRKSHVPWTVLRFECQIVVRGHLEDSDIKAAVLGETGICRDVAGAARSSTNRRGRINQASLDNKCGCVRMRSRVGNFDQFRSDATKRRGKAKVFFGET